MAKNIDIISALTGRIAEYQELLNRKYSLTDSHLQFLTNSNSDVLGEFSAILRNKLTLDALKTMCEEIAAFVGGSLYGTVNVDFSGSCYSFEMMIEFQEKKHCR